MAKDKKKSGGNYLKTTTTSKGRTVRLEVIGGASRAETNFLNGIIFFAAGTISRNSDKHLTYVAGIMTRLIHFLVSKIKGEPQPDKVFEPDANQQAAAPSPVQRAVGIKEESDVIKLPIDFLAKNVGSLVANAVDIEKAKGTRLEMIATLACGALVFSLAQLHLLLKAAGYDAPKKYYMDTVTAMLSSALDDLAKK